MKLSASRNNKTSRTRLIINLDQSLPSDCPQQIVSKFVKTCPSESLLHVRASHPTLPTVLHFLCVNHRLPPLSIPLPSPVGLTVSGTMLWGTIVFTKQFEGFYGEFLTA